MLESPAPIQKTAAGYVLNPVRWQMPVDRIERITNLRRGELERMQVYMGSQDCLMQFLAEELNDPNAGTVRQVRELRWASPARRLPRGPCSSSGGIPRTVRRILSSHESVGPRD